MAGDFICPTCGQYQCVCGYVLLNLLGKNTYGGGIAQGWMCPRCGQVYSPFVMMCGTCGPTITSGDSTNVVEATVGDG